MTLIPLIVLTGVILSLIKGTAGLHVSTPCCSDELQRESTFGPRLPISEPGITGKLYLAGNGCESSINDFKSAEGWKKIFLVQRGGCSFVDKVLNAQKLGAHAVIVYDNRVESNLIAMASQGANTREVRIPSVFISKHAGERLIMEKAQVVSLSRSDDVPSIDMFSPSIFIVAWMFVMTFLFLIVLTLSLTLKRCCFGNSRRLYNINEPSESNDFYYEGMSDSEESDISKDDSYQDQEDSNHKINSDNSLSDESDDDCDGPTVRLSIRGNGQMEPLLISV